MDSWHPLVAPLVDKLTNDGKVMKLPAPALAQAVMGVAALSPDEKRQVATHLTALARRIHLGRGSLDVDAVLDQLADAAVRVLGDVKVVKDGFVKAGMTEVAKRLGARETARPLAVGEKPPEGSLSVGMLGVKRRL
jgi:hypothetical protein